MLIAANCFNASPIVNPYPPAGHDATLPLAVAHLGGNVTALVVLAGGAHAAAVRNRSVDVIPTPTVAAAALCHDPELRNLPFHRRRGFFTEDMPVWPYPGATWQFNQ